MSQPKQPQDHQQKKEKATVEKVDGGKLVTLRGVTVTVLDEALDDFELLEDLARIQNDERQRGLLPSVLRRIVGDDGYKTVMDGLRGDNGRVSVQSGVTWINDLFVALNPNS